MRARIALASALLLFFFTHLGTGQDAPPTIAQHGVVNLASRMPARLTGDVIAAGSLVSIQGFRLGPAAEATPAAGSAVSTSLAGVEVKIKQGAVEIDALPTMVSATEIHAFLPESVPLGNVEIRVVRSGIPSRTPARVRVVESSFGAFSQNGRGWGSGDLRNADGQLNSVEHAAKPGEMVTLRGTGLGAAAQPQSIQVMLGNRQTPAAKVSHKDGPALGGIPGVYEIAFAVPPDTPEGCYVPVRVLSGGHVSNTVTATINHSDGACSMPESWMASLADRPGKLAFLALVRVALRLVVTRREKADFLMDVGYANFELKKSGGQHQPYYMFPPVGTCNTLTSPLASLVGFVSAPVQSMGLPLDAGPGIALRGADGERKLPRAKTTVLGGETPWPQAQSKHFPLFLTPGDFTFSAPGGREVGPFSSTVHVIPPVDWTNRDAIGTVDREHGVTVKWRAARQDGWVLITAINSDEESGGVALCSCIEHASAGSFHVPPDALANIPPTAAKPEGLPTNMLLVAELPGADTARTTSLGGIEQVIAFFASASARNVSYR